MTEKTPMKPKKFKERTRGFVAGVLASVLLLGITGTTLAASGAINIDIYPAKILVNNEVFQPKDVNGNDVMVFIHNGTTYAPVRALAEAYGLEVGWDATNGTASVVDPDKVVKEDAPSSDESTNETETNQELFPTEENRRTIISQFVMINGELYECLYSHELKIIEDLFIRDGFLCYIDENPSDLFFKANNSSRFDRSNLFAFLTDTFKTTTSDNPFVTGAIDTYSTHYSTNTISVSSEKQYISATNFTKLYTHKYNGKTLTIPELSSEKQVIEGIRCYDGYVSVNDYCDYFGINAEIKVEYNETVGKDIIVVDYN